MTKREKYHEAVEQGYLWMGLAVSGWAMAAGLAWRFL